METCYKVFRREVIQSIDVEEDRFGFEPEVTAKVAQGGWRVYELGISYRGRTYDEGEKIGWRDGVWAVWCMLKYSPRAARPRELARGLGVAPARRSATGPGLWSGEPSPDGRAGRPRRGPGARSSASAARADSAGDTGGDGAPAGSGT